jgi:hypothetical protein
MKGLLLLTSHCVNLCAKVTPGIAFDALLSNFLYNTKRRATAIYFSFSPISLSSTISPTKTTQDSRRLVVPAWLSVQQDPKTQDTQLQNWRLVPGQGTLATQVPLTFRPDGKSASIKGDTFLPPRDFESCDLHGPDGSYVSAAHPIFDDEIRRQLSHISPSSDPLFCRLVHAELLTADDQNILMIGPSDKSKYTFVYGQNDAEECDVGSSAPTNTVWGSDLHFVEVPQSERGGWYRTKVPQSTHTPFSFLP